MPRGTSILSMLLFAVMLLAGTTNCAKKADEEAGGGEGTKGQSSRSQKTPGVIKVHSPDVAFMPDADFAARMDLAAMRESPIYERLVAASEKNRGRRAPRPGVPPPGLARGGARRLRV